MDAMFNDQPFLSLLKQDAVEPCESIREPPILDSYELRDHDHSSAVMVVNLSLSGFVLAGIKPAG